MAQIAALMRTLLFSNSDMLTCENGPQIDLKSRYVSIQNRFRRFRKSKSISKLTLIPILNYPIGVHGWAWSTSFLIQAPSMRVGWPSSAILISGARGGSSGWILQVCVSCSLCSFVPIGMISVFSRLNFAPEALHQVERMFSRSVYLSDKDRYIVVSSA
jgi:hypothetical protein